MWATKQPRQTRDEVLRGLDVTTKRVNLWSGCRWIPELRLPLGHDAYNFARIARDLPARSSSCERGPAAISVTASIAFAQQLRVDAIAVECILPSVARRGAARRASRAQERQFTCGVG